MDAGTGPSRQPALPARIPALTLFDPRASAPALAETSVAGGAPKLQGIVIAGRRRRALVAFGDTAPVWLEPGQAQGEWTLVRVGSSEVRLASPSGTQDLQLFPRATPQVSTP